jgi:hypothetical protein
MKGEMMIVNKARQGFRTMSSMYLDMISEDVLLSFLKSDF